MLGVVGRLTEPQYRATMEPGPRRVNDGEPPPFDFWYYFDLIPDADFEGHDFAEGEVAYAWRMPSGTLEHVLVRCATPQIFLVLVLDLRFGTVYGHYLLDLRDFSEPG